MPPGTSGWLRMRVTSSATLPALVRDREPVDVRRGLRAGAGADVVEALGTQRRGLEAVRQEPGDDLVGEELHAAVGVVDDEPFLVPSSLYEITSERIASSLARPPALRMTCASPSAEPGVLGRVEPGVHAGEDGEASCRRQRQVGLSRTTPRTPRSLREPHRVPALLILSTGVPPTLRRASGRE